MSYRVRYFGEGSQISTNQKEENRYRDREMERQVDDRLTEAEKVRQTYYHTRPSVVVVLQQVVSRAVA